MKILVTGAAGQLGTDVASVFLESGHLVFACDRNIFDITDFASCEAVVKNFGADVVIHCAAYTNVDQAEEEVETAYRINAAGTRNLVVACERIKAKFCYISTDYVFDGTSEAPYHEYDNPNPQSIYGKSKLAGEVLVKTLSTRFFIVRTSWVYGLHGHNFVKTVMKLGREKDSLQIVNDQTGSPTFTEDLACFLEELVQTDRFGIYHASNSGTCTWYEFAKKIFEEAELITGEKFKARIQPCTTEEYPLSAPRPRNSVMAHWAIRSNGFMDLRGWEKGLKSFLDKYLDQ